MSNERRYKVLTAVGRDRPGLVQKIASAIHESGANLEDSRMAILGGEFALILLLSGSADAVSKANERVRELGGELALRVFMDDTAKAPQGAFLPYRLKVSGFDHPGIVAAVTRVLASRAVNVASLESRVQYAPESGTPMFLLGAELQVPSEEVLGALRAELVATCEDESLEFTLERG
jgi:glycine cleavage system transcriptional repressor